MTQVTDSDTPKNRVNMGMEKNIQPISNWIPSVYPFQYT
jgi:hypothetical protein